MYTSKMNEKVLLCFWHLRPIFTGPGIKDIGEFNHLVEMQKSINMLDSLHGTWRFSRAENGLWLLQWGGDRQLLIC